MQPSWEGHKQGAACVAAVASASRAATSAGWAVPATAPLQTRQESENKAWLTAEFLFPVKQVPYRTRMAVCVYLAGCVCYPGPQTAFNFLEG